MNALGRSSAVALVMVAATACSTPSPPTTMVSVELVDPAPTFVAFRDGSAAWTTPLPVRGGTYAAYHYELEVTDDFELVVVVAPSDMPDVASYELLATASDATDWLLGNAGAIPINGSIGPLVEPPCLTATSPPAPSAIVVSGVMAEPGTIAIGDACASNVVGSWPFQLAVTPGDVDVLASDLEATVLAQWRHLDVSGATDLGTIDLTTSGQPLAVETLPVISPGDANQPQDFVSALLLATTGATTLLGQTESALSASYVVPIVPPALLEPGDVQTLVIALGDTTGATDYAWTTAPEQVAELDLLAVPNGSVDLSGITAQFSWTGGDLRTQAFTLSIVAPTLLGLAGTQSVTVSPRWLIEHDPPNIAFDPGATGYQTAWDLNLTTPTSAQLTESAVDGAVAYASSEPVPVFGNPVPRTTPRVTPLPARQPRSR